MPSSIISFIVLVVLDNILASFDNNEYFDFDYNFVKKKTKQKKTIEIIW